MMDLFDALLFEAPLSAPSSSAPPTTSIGKKRDRAADLQDFEDIFECTPKRITVSLDGLGDDDVLEDLPVDALMPAVEEPNPFPFYHYVDYSSEMDPDALTPLTPPGRVPNFPAKMQAILSRPDLAGIVSWMPHGRSWRVLKPREFEVRVIPTYFEHSKFSSFIRQANGWGFRRITQGKDRNTYYHPRFLRGLPHLCKNMKRPAVAEKQAADPEHEPDLYKISEMHPLPEKANDESIMLECTLKGGPKARMPIYSGAPSMFDYSFVSKPELGPSDQHAIAAFQMSLGASENQLTSNFIPGGVTHVPEVPSNLPNTVPRPSVPHATLSRYSVPLHFNEKESQGASPLALANQMAFSEPTESNNGNVAEAQFAAGFAAATALSQQQFQKMLESMQMQGLLPAQNFGASM